MTIRDRITALCQNATISDKDLIVALEAEISKLIPFNHKHPNKMDACGIFDDIEMKIAGAGTFSEIVEMVERSNPKRTLAYIFTKEMILRNTKNTSPTLIKSLEDIDSDVAKYLSKILGSGVKTSQITEEEVQMRCNEEDTSECYKCPISKSCTKFKN